MAKYFTERKSVQDPLVKYVSGSADKVREGSITGQFDLDWEYVSREGAVTKRGGEAGVLFHDVFREQIKKLNPDFMTDEIADKLISDIERIPPNVEGNLIAWEYLTGKRSVFVPAEDRERNVNLIDTENIENNIFQVTDEMTFTNGTHTIRPDVVFFINGIPVIIAEPKAPHKKGGINEAFGKQIVRYHRQAPELMSLIHAVVVTTGTKFYYSSSWNFSSKFLFNWKEEQDGDYTKQSYEYLVKSFFDRERVVKTISDFILFTREDDELKKIILRPHQMDAVEKVTQRAKNENKKRGLVWHTQGSGKTYSMIVAAKKILENPVFENPTVIMLVDRNELETQLFGNIEAVYVENVKVAKRKKHLRRLLKDDERGLIVSMIHKFKDMPADVNTRENVFVLVDEAHRTTGGDLGNFLMGALPNASYIGFTGTPIDKTEYGKGTFKVFGKDDPPYGYLDKYSIGESIEDKTTVPLRYSLAPNNLLVDRDTLEEEFLNLADLHGVSDPDVLNEVLEKTVNLRNMLKNKKRVRDVAEFVAKHYKENVEPLGYKAFLVGVDREACAMYKKELDQLLPEEYSQVVYSTNYNDPPELEEHHLSDDEEKQIRKDFRNPEKLPKILIVTEKLLTGFDAPVLYSMYLDKPMRDHVLLQAIARVNRPYEDDVGRKKPSGLIIDFVGIFEKLEKALAYDSKDIEGIIEDIEKLKDRFVQLMEIAGNEYLTVLEDYTEDKAVEAVLNSFFKEEDRDQFYATVRETIDIYDILSPDKFLRPYLEDYESLVCMYRIVKEAFDTEFEPVDREFQQKTAKLVQEHTQSGKIRGGLEVYEINEETIKKLEESGQSDTEKVFNLGKSIMQSVDKELEDNPYLIPSGTKQSA